MLKVIFTFFRVILKSLGWLAPLLKSIVPAAVGASISVYGVWSLLTSIIDSNIVAIERIFDKTIDTIGDFAGSFVNSGTGAFFSYVTALDELLTVIAGDIALVMVFLNFLFIGLIAIIIGFVVKLISVQIAKFIARNVALSTFDPTQAGPV